MSNIHGMGDVRRNNPPGYGAGQGGQPQASNYAPLPFTIQQSVEAGDPRKESFFDMVKFVCCPQFTWRSFLFAITVVDVFIFFIVLLIGGVKQDKNSALLEPNPYTLVDFGAKYPYLQRYEYQVWRFVMPMFLHAGFTHIVYNVISQLIFGTSIEARYGTVKIVILYITSGIGGNLFSSLWSDELSVGASTCVFGLLGSQLGFLILNWTLLDYPNSGREKFLFILILIIFFNFWAGLGNSQVDNYGHLGGLICGIFLGLCTFDAIRGANESRYVKNCRIIGYVLTGLFFVLGFLIFYTARTPRDLYDLGKK